IGAFYSGSALFTASSNGLPQAVNPAPTSTTLVSSLNPSTYHNSVTYTATVGSGIGTPGGTVTFKDGATVLGTGSLSGGKASFTTSALSGGSHSIIASYGGTKNFAVSTSSALTQTVNPAATATALKSSANPSAFHQTVTFTATVTSPAGVAFGSVTFKNGSVALGTAALNATGVATLSTNGLAAGAHSMTAVYSGNADFR